MIIDQFLWKDFAWHSKEKNTTSEAAYDFTLMFGDRFSLEASSTYLDEFKKKFSSKHIVICSTSGSIQGDTLYENEVIATSIAFSKASCELLKYDATGKDSTEIGRQIANDFNESSVKDLRLIMVFSDGQNVNGSDLVIGINQNLKMKIPVTGGLAGDADRFEKTLVGLNEAPKENMVIAIGFYGNLEIGHGSKGGWDPFGPERVITKADKNVLYELDGENALELYKRYLGERAKELPGSALLFPLHLSLPDSNDKVVRTILSIDEEKSSMTFAGNLPVGSKVQLMKAN